jgi:hypothetical protein
MSGAAWSSFRGRRGQRHGGSAASGTGGTSLGGVSKWTTPLPRTTRKAVIHATLLVARSELPNTRTAPVPTSGLTRFRFHVSTLPTPEAPLNLASTWNSLTPAQKAACDDYSAQGNMDRAGGGWGN